MLLSERGCESFRIRTFGQRDSVFFVSERDVYENLVFFVFIVNSLSLGIFFNKVLISGNSCLSLLNIVLLLQVGFILRRCVFRRSFWFNWCRFWPLELLCACFSASFVAQYGRFEGVSFWISCPFNRIDCAVKFKSLELLSHCMQLLPFRTFLSVFGFSVVHFWFESEVWILRGFFKLRKNFLFLFVLLSLFNQLVGVVFACEESVFLGYQLFSRLVNLRRESRWLFVKLFFSFHTDVVLLFCAHHKVLSILVQSDCTPINEIELLLRKQGFLTFALRFGYPRKCKVLNRAHVCFQVAKCSFSLIGGCIFWRTQIVPELLKYYILIKSALFVEEAHLVHDLFGA